MWGDRMRERILVVDDEERLRDLLEAYLQREGFEVLQAENGMEALKIMKKSQVHLVLLDVMMPVMDGIQTLSEIRRFTNIPVIMLTAKAEEDDKLMGFEFGTDIYLSKPLSPKVVIANVKALIKRNYYLSSRETSVGCFDGLTIDEASHEVLVDGVSVNLSPKEYELLLYFIKNKGLVLTREKILDAIWGFDFDGDARTVDTHIKRLREKLGEKANLICTVRGSGYKFEAKYKL